MDVTVHDIVHERSCPRAGLRNARSSLHFVPVTIMASRLLLVAMGIAIAAR